MQHTITLPTPTKRRENSGSQSTPTKELPSMNELSVDFAKRYRNNPHETLPVSVPSCPGASTSTRRRNELLVRVAVSLCPELVLSTFSTSQSIQLDESYWWNFASVDERQQKKQRSSPRSTTLSEGDERQVDHDGHDENKASQVVISIFSTVAQNAEEVMEIPFIIKPLTGGLSNLLFTVENISSMGSTRSVLVRIHPSSDGDVVNREYENELLAWLSRRHDHLQHKAVSVPLFYGRFANGRVEEFYQNYRPLSCHEMKVVNKDDEKLERASHIARLLARMHSTTLRQTIIDHLGQKEVSANGYGGTNDASSSASRSSDACPLLHKSSILTGNNGSISDSTSFSGDIFSRIDSWFDRIDAVLSQRLSSSDDEQHNDLKELRSLLGEKWKSLQSKLLSVASSPQTGSVTATARDFGQQVVLTHMDAQSLNLLVEEESHVCVVSGGASQQRNTASVSEIPIKLIDYEYAGFNPRVADIANTFCEHCDMNNLRAKYDAEYPTLEHQGYFLRSYVDEVLRLSSGKEFDALGQHYTNANERTREEFITALSQDIGRFTLLSHLGWAVWSCVQHVNRQQCSDDDNGNGMDPVDEEDDFDYLAYARHRMEGYRHFQERY